jgi:hypothetical protein
LITESTSEKLVNITDLMSDLYEGINDAQTSALWGGPHDWHILCLTKAFLSILEHFQKMTLLSQDF